MGGLLNRIKVLYCPCISRMIYRSKVFDIKTDVYLTGINPDDNFIYQAEPCPICARTIIQAGIHNVIMRQGESTDNYVILPAKELQWVLDTDSMNS